MVSANDDPNRPDGQPNDPSRDLPPDPLTFDLPDCDGEAGAYDPLDPQADPFKPPAIPTEVCCLHCGREYESYLIEWRVKRCHDGQRHGFWCCPTPGCDGAGFGFDLFPTDPEYIGEDGEPMGFFCDEQEQWDEAEPLDGLGEDLFPDTPSNFGEERDDRPTDDGSDLPY
jgi:hypothetical protein